jgi:hypothetical protein
MNKSMIYSGCFIWLSLISQALAAGAISVTIRSHCSVTLAGFPRSKKTCADWHLATPQHMAGHHLLSAFAEQRPRGPRSVEIVCAQGTQETMSYTCAYMSIHIISLYIYTWLYELYVHGHMYTSTCCMHHHVCIHSIPINPIILLYQHRTLVSHVVTSGKHSPFTGFCNVTSLVRGLTGLSPKMTATWTKMCSPCDAANLAQNFSIFESLLMFVKFGARPHLRMCYRIVYT